MRADCSRASVALIESWYRPRRSAVLARILAVLDGRKTSEGPAGNGTSAKLAGLATGHDAG
jgi:proline racemase